MTLRTALALALIALAPACGGPFDDYAPTEYWYPSDGPDDPYDCATDPSQPGCPGSVDPYDCDTDPAQPGCPGYDPYDCAADPSQPGCEGEGA
jgi:hypothetical protein